MEVGGKEGVPMQVEERGGHGGMVYHIVNSS